MDKYVDRITEAYFDGMGVEFGRISRTRIHWICDNIKGEKFLDVGCSQGITCILAGREEKIVIGIDIILESIQYANKILSNENEKIQENIKFICNDFIAYDFKDSLFDTIAMTEVLEHLNNPIEFIKKSYDLLNDSGTMIVTVPFGINDYPDHKKTYYFIDLIKELSPYIEINNIRYFGKWIGVVGTKREKIKSIDQCIDIGAIEQLEKAFYKIERGYINKLKDKNDKQSK